MASMAHSGPENHVAMTAARAAELDSVSVHMYLGLIERLFNVRKGLRANSHPPSAQELSKAFFHRGEVSRPAGGRTTLPSVSRQSVRYAQ